MSLKTHSLNSYFINLRRELIPLSLRKTGKALLENTLWRLGLSPVPSASTTPITSAKLKRLLGKENPTILEIGCNDGEHTLWFLNAFARPTIFCFEPEPRAIKRFQKNVGARTGVTLVPVAASDTDGVVEFYQSSGTPPWAGFDHLEEGGWDYSGSIKKPKQHLEELPWVKYETKIQVPAKKIDSWLDEVPLEIIDFIWMDVQGAELSVIQGMAKNLSRIRYIYTEYNDKEMYEGQASLLQLLKALPDFEVVARYPEDILLKNTAFGSKRNHR